MCAGVGESHLSGESFNPPSRKEGSIGADMGGVRVGGLAASCGSGSLAARGCGAHTIGGGTSLKLRLRW
jgi:hypothetical protein